MKLKDLGDLPEKTAIGLILAASLLGRLVAAPFLRGISGGDFFNFLLITQKLVHFQNPFFAKRLPFYPLLLIPGHLLGHPIGWAKILGILGSLGTLVVFYLLGRQLKIKKEILYLALIFASFQPTLFIYSLRPLTHTLFTLEVLLALYLLYRSNKSYMTYGIVLGLMSMTRHEGFVVAAVLFCISAIHCALRARTEVRYYITSFATFSIVVAPYFISNYLRFGNPVYTGYMEDPGLNRVTDLQSFFANFEKVKWIILNLWGEIGYFPIKWALIPAVLVLLVWMMIREVRVCRVIGGIGLLAFWAGLYFWGPFEGLLQLLAFLFASLTILGGLKFILETKWRGVPFLLILGTQTILLLFIQPWARHLQHTFPFWALFLAVGLKWILEGLRGIFRWLAIVVLSGIVLLNSYFGIRQGIAEHNRGVLRTASLFDAIEYCRNLDGKIGFETDFSAFRYYFGDRGRYYLTGQEIIPVNKLSEETWVGVDDQMAWVKKNDLDYLVRYYLFDIFNAVEYVDEDRDYANNFRLEERFEHDLDGVPYWTEVHRVVK